MLHPSNPGENLGNPDFEVNPVNGPASSITFYNAEKTGLNEIIMTIDEADSTRIVTLYENTNKNGSILIYNDNYTDGVVGAEVIATTSSGIQIKYAPYDDVQAYCWTTKDGIHIRYTPPAIVHDDIVEIVENIVIVKREAPAIDLTNDIVIDTLYGPASTILISGREMSKIASVEIAENGDMMHRTRMNMAFVNGQISDFNVYNEYGGMNTTGGSTTIGTSASGLTVTYDANPVITTGETTHAYYWTAQEGIYLAITSPSIIDDNIILSIADNITLDVRAPK